MVVHYSQEPKDFSPAIVNLRKRSLKRMFLLKKLPLSETHRDKKSNQCHQIKNGTLKNVLANQFGSLD